MDTRVVDINTKDSRYTRINSLDPVFGDESGALVVKVTEANLERETLSHQEWVNIVLDRTSSAQFTTTNDHLSVDSIMNHLSWFLLATLVVWLKAEHLTQSPNQTEVDMITRLMRQFNEKFAERPAEEEEESTEDEEEDNPTDNARSESTSVPSINRTDSDVIRLLKNHKMNPQLEQLNPQLLKYATKSDHHVLNDIVRNLMVNNQSTEVNDCSIIFDLTISCQVLEKQPTEEKNYTIKDWNQIYQEMKEDSKQLDEPHGTYGPSYVEFSPPPEYGGHRSFVAASSDRYFSPTSDRYLTPPSKIIGYSSNEGPTSLSNFYLSSDPNSFANAYETQSNDHKEINDSKLPTVKDLISTTKTTDPKLSYKPGNFDNDNFNQYLTCCDKLFQNYGKKQMIHEDVYLIPKEEPYVLPRKYPIPTHQFFASYPTIESPPTISTIPTSIKPMRYTIRRYPSMTGLKGLGNFGTSGLGTSGLTGIGNTEFRPVPVISTSRLGGGSSGLKKVEVECRNDGHTFPEPHYVPVIRASQLPPAVFRPPPSSSSSSAVAALLLKKKLALFGKKYLLG